MASKRKLHHLLVILRPIGTHVFLIGFIISGLIAVLALRSNNIRMIELREQVSQADQSGKDIDEALNNLRSHVYSHMNTDLSSGGLSIKPPIQLKYTYERLVEKEKSQVAKKNETVTASATRVCEARHPAGQIRARAQCVQQYITANSVKENSVPKELYQFDFVSPVWSPDLAGFSLLISAVFLFLAIIRFGLERWLKSQLD